MIPQRIERLFDFIDYLNERMLKEEANKKASIGMFKAKLACENLFKI